MSGKTDKKHISPSAGLSPLLQRMPLVCMAVFAVVAVVLLGAVCHDYLRELDELSFFMGGSWFFSHCLSEPAGLLYWLSSFFTQFFYYPWLGATLLTLMLVGLWLLIAKAFRLPKALMPVASLPSAMMLLFMLMPGYLIFMSKTPGFAFNGVLGFAFSVAVYYAYTRTASPLLRMALALVAACTYPLFGFYSLFGVLLCVVAELAGPRKWWLAVAAALLIGLVPVVWFYGFESHLMLKRLYVAGLPRMAVSYKPLMNTYWIAAVFIVIAAVLSGRMKAEKVGNTRVLVIALSVFVLSVASVFVFRYRDANFNTTISMQLALGDGDPAKAAAVARELKEKPTRVVNLLTHISLFNEGTAGDSLFTYQMADARYNSPYPTVALRMSAARALNYYLGRINDSYRWNMEDMVEYGYKVSYLKNMAKCALLNGEYKLARRYLRMLSGTMFHSGWADKYMAYADNPELMKNDREFTTIAPLMAYNSRIGGDSGMIELYLSMSIAGLRGGPPPLVELSLQFNLVQKSIENFWPRFMLYARTHKVLPKHYQEAAILFSALENKVDWRQFNIDPTVVNRFTAFMDMARRNSRFSDEQNRELFEPLFGDTYWFYYFFVKDLKTT